MGCFSAAGSSSTSDSKTETQRRVSDQAIDLYGGQLGLNEKVYPGSGVAPFTDLQKDVLTGAQGFTDYFSEQTNVGTPLFDETGATISSFLTGTPGASNINPQQVDQYFTEKVKDPTLRTLREDINPLIDEAHAGPGFFGSSRSNARVDAATDISNYLTEQRAGLEFDVLQRNQQLDEAKANRSLAAIPQAQAFGQVPAQEIMNNLNIAAQKVGGLAAIFGFGQAEQTQEQAKLQDEISRFAAENQITDPDDLAILLTLLGMSFSRSSGSQQGAGLGYAGATSFLGSVGEGMATPNP